LLLQANTRPSYRPASPRSIALTLPRPRSTVVLKDVSEGAILFCTESETYFSLNSVGVRIWRLLPPVCSTEAEVVGQLRTEHPEVDAAIISADLRLLLDELQRNKLVEALQPA
jgi:hypothetical protein